MNDYETIYGIAFDHAYDGEDSMEGEQVRFTAGIAAVAAAAKAEALTEPNAALQKHNARLVIEFMEQPEFKAMLADVRATAKREALEEAATELPTFSPDGYGGMKLTDVREWLTKRAEMKRGES